MEPFVCPRYPRLQICVVRRVFVRFIFEADDKSFRAAQLAVVMAHWFLHQTAPALYQIGRQANLREALGLNAALRFYRDVSSSLHADLGLIGICDGMSCAC